MSWAWIGLSGEALPPDAPGSQPGKVKMRAEIAIIILVFMMDIHHPIIFIVPLKI
jgi:hypothetical protein